MTAAENNQSSDQDLRDSLRERMGSEDDTSQGAGPGASVPQEHKSLMDVFNTNLAITGPGLAQMTAFCRQLATLIDVGIPLVQALGILAQRTEHPGLKRTVADVAQRVEEGSSFSEALEAHPKTFSSLVVNVVRIGESAGILEGALKYLAELMERRYELRRRLTGALAYPVCVLVLCGIALMVLLGFAIPVFAQTYESAGVELPGITQFIIGCSDFVRGWWWLIIILVVAAVFVVRSMLRNSTGARKSWDYMCLKMPVVRLVAVKSNVTRTARTLSNLLQAGIPLLEALQITAETSENVVVAEMMGKTRDHVETGGNFEEPLREANIFPPLVVDMIAVGDEAGRLDLMFDKIAETYDADLQQSIQIMNAILEPFLIVVMGGVVITIALAVLLPYWRMGDIISQ